MEKSSGAQSFAPKNCMSLSLIPISALCSKGPFRATENMWAHKEIRSCGQFEQQTASHRSWRQQRGGKGVDWAPSPQGERRKNRRREGSMQHPEDSPKVNTGARLPRPGQKHWLSIASIQLFLGICIYFISIFILHILSTLYGVYIFHSLIFFLSAYTVVF